MSYRNNNIDYNQEETSVENIAKIIFSKSPQNRGRYKLFPPEADNEIIFEILLTLFMEGILILNNNLEGLDLNNMDQNILYGKLLELSDWFISLDYYLYVTKIDRDEYTNDQYCKILLKNMDEIYFRMKNIDKEYTFILNANRSLHDNLKDYNALFMLNNFAYRISFTKNPDNTRFL